MVTLCPVPCGERNTAQCLSPHTGTAWQVPLLMKAKSHLHCPKNQLVLPLMFPSHTYDRMALIDQESSLQVLQTEHDKSTSAKHSQA